MSKYLEYETPAQCCAEELAGNFSLANHGLINLGKVYWNLSEPLLYEESIIRGETRVAQGGALLVNTSKCTNNTANDQYIVKEPNTSDKINWGIQNRPLDAEKFSEVINRIQAYLQGKEVFVQDLYAGTDAEYALPIRIITDTAWQSLFARNMFIKPNTREEYCNHVPEFTLIALPDFKLDPRIDGTLTETGIIADFSKRLAIIANSGYAGEIKNTIFKVMNFFKPLEGVLPLHCSANIGKQGDMSLFFGLSRAGKTTLSIDTERFLIGDDEHGWSHKGIFNLENGCYAKVNSLSPKAEPEIYACTHRFGSILENVKCDATSGKIELNDDTLTENSRISFPLEFITNAIPEKKVDKHPRHIIFLTADAQGVLPPLASLDLNQAVYHFLSGYTSTITGNETIEGKEPQIAFSACFGAPFMVYHPYFYANILKKKIEAYGSKVWLVNTGWVGGKFGTGKRISIDHTRNMISAILNGDLDKVEYRTDKLFGINVPTSCPNVPKELFFPENAWSNKDEYWKQYDALAARYIENFKLLEDGLPEEVLSARPKRLNEISL